MKAIKSKLRQQPQPNGPYTDVDAALAGITDEQWRQLARLAECRLRDLRTDPRLARYLAGSRGEEIVHTAVVAVQLGAKTPRTGRAVTNEHLAHNGTFLAHLKQIIKSVTNNFRRHKAGRILHQTIGDKIIDGVLCDPADTADLQKDILLKDLLGVLLPRVLLDLADKPKQRAVLQEWARTNAQDAILPPVQSKFVRFCVRQAIVKQLRALAAHDLKLQHPTGKELLF